jgi:hypothetical protein
MSRLEVRRLRVRVRIRRGGEPCFSSRYKESNSRLGLEVRVGDQEAYCTISRVKMSTDIG